MVEAAFTAALMIAAAALLHEALSWASEWLWLRFPTITQNAARTVALAIVWAALTGALML